MVSNGYTGFANVHFCMMSCITEYECSIPGPTPGQYGHINAALPESIKLLVPAH